MRVKFKKAHGGNKVGDVGSLPDLIAKRRIEEGICEAVEKKKGKGEPKP